MYIKQQQVNMLRGGTRTADEASVSVVQVSCGKENQGQRIYTEGAKLNWDARRHISTEQTVKDSKRDSFQHA